MPSDVPFLWEFFDKNYIYEKMVNEHHLLRIQIQTSSITSNHNKIKINKYLYLRVEEWKEDVELNWS